MIKKWEYLNFKINHLCTNTQHAAVINKSKQYSVLIHERLKKNHTRAKEKSSYRNRKLAACVLHRLPHGPCLKTWAGAGASQSQHRQNLGQGLADNARKKTTLIHMCELHYDLPRFHCISHNLIANFRGHADTDTGPLTTPHVWRHPGAHTVKNKSPGTHLWSWHRVMRCLGCWNLCTSQTLTQQIHL